MEPLTHVEEETMQAVWRTGEGNVKAFMEHLGEAIPYTTVASTIKNLEKKGYLSSRLVGNAYLYNPVVSEADYKKKFMGKVVKEYFDNSYKELVNFFVEQKKLSAKELKEIITMIEKGQ
jgi:BlaI family transcriptional regulator, penicillinase repressor